MTNLARFRLAHASSNSFSDTDWTFSEDAYVRCFLGQGYASRTVQIYSESITHFAHWCASRRIDLAEIDESVVKSFLCRHLPLCHCAKRCQRHSAAAALAHLLNYLRNENKIAPKKSPYPATISE